MKSLFSHSLLNDTDRDVRGAYRVFSRGTVHAALPGKDTYDGSSANVNPSRKKLCDSCKRNGKNAKSCRLIS